MTENLEASKEVPKLKEALLDAYKSKEETQTYLDAKSISENVSLLERLPTPTGWRLLVLPYAGPKKTKGGIILSDQTQDTIQMTTVCAYVLKVGELAYKDKEKFPNGPWCKEGEWVIFGRYAGSRFKIEGGEVRILNDDEIIAKINNPEDILHAY
uniref:Co-chaperonin GroES n=1 Tax=uncultured virus TaxID=340016 RepID=A0A221S413_9VIRU|nr:co-chaperonin GroES [uncultured virus]ASN63621.1 co-chaperonin GroES [uncultured virus]